MTVERRELSVRGTPIHLLTAGAGPPLLFLHGAGGAGRWLPFQERLAKTFTVPMPSHPGHRGSTPGGWDEHVFPLALHYLYLPHGLGLPPHQLSGAAFGGRESAEVAAAAAHP